MERSTRNSTLRIVYIAAALCTSCFQQANSWTVQEPKTLHNGEPNYSVLYIKEASIVNRTISALTIADWGLMKLNRIAIGLGGNSTACIFQELRNLTNSIRSIIETYSEDRIELCDSFRGSASDVMDAGYNVFGGGPLIPEKDKLGSALANTVPTLRHCFVELDNEFSFVKSIEQMDRKCSTNVKAYLPTVSKLVFRLYPLITKVFYDLIAQKHIGKKLN